MNKITIHTDGSANNKTKIGGFGIVLRSGEHQKDYSEGSYHQTTSARMEIMAILRSLEICSEGWKIEIFSDNEYAVNTIKKGWLKNWIATGQLDQKANADLWRLMLVQLKRHENNLSINHIKGHAGHPMNELADKLANQGRLMDRIIIDKR